MQPHHILGVTPDADIEEIQYAYYERIKQSHPDHGGSKEEFIKVREAYEELSEKRQTQNTMHQESFETATVEYLNDAVLQRCDWASDRSVVEAFEEAKQRDLNEGDYGSFTVQRNQKILKAAEAAGKTWPFSCRGGACANCAVFVVTGDVTTPAHAILSEELRFSGYRLSCIGTPLTERIQLLYNVKDRPELEDMLLTSQSEFE